MLSPKRLPREVSTVYSLIVQDDSSLFPSREGDAEDAPLIDLLMHLFEAGGAHEFVHLGLGASAHDPGFAFAIGQNARDEFNLRVPRLIGVDEITAGFDCVGKSAQ